MDGNFQLDRKRANGEGEYMGLTDGQIYFPNQKDFVEYLSEAIDEPSVSFYIIAYTLDPYIVAAKNL
jgi:hypothetical protein